MINQDLHTKDEIILNDIKNYNDITKSKDNVINSRALRDIEFKNSNKSSNPHQLNLNLSQIKSKSSDKPPI